MLWYNVLASAFYVGSVYLLPSDIRSLSRENPVHIRWRMLLISLYTCMLLIITYFFVYPHGPNSISFGELVGVKLDLKSNIFSVASTVLLMSIFYLGKHMFSILLGWYLFYA